MPRLSDTQVQQRPLIAIVGPTAVGKSRLACDLAAALDCEILAADSRQVYRGMDIGTDKPSITERQAVPHRLIDLVEPDQPFNTGLYRRLAIASIEAQYDNRRLPLVVGGTGLYVRTLLRGLCPAPPSDPVIRETLRHEIKLHGRDALYAQLVKCDPVTAARLHPSDQSKVLRALEVYRLSGRPLSEFQRQHGFSEHPFQPLIIGLNRSREALYKRIEDRIDWQLANGLLDETKALLARGYRRDLPAMKGLGYRHISSYLAGEYDFHEMVRRFKQDTRRFAKRQMTWFRKEPGIHWLTCEESEPPAATMERALQRIEYFLAGLEDRRMSQC
jgi:tRNA dimethylallyltransferase